MTKQRQGMRKAEEACLNINKLFSISWETEMEEYLEMLILILIWWCWLNLQVNLSMSGTFIAFWLTGVCQRTQKTQLCVFSKAVHSHCWDGLIIVPVLLGLQDPSILLAQVIPSSQPASAAVWQKPGRCGVGGKPVPLPDSTEGPAACLPALPAWRAIFWQLPWDLLWKDKADFAQLMFSCPCSEPCSVGGTIPDGSLSWFNVCSSVFQLLMHSLHWQPQRNRARRHDWCVFSSWLWPHFLECSFVRYVKVVI